MSPRTRWDLKCPKAKMCEYRTQDAQVKKNHCQLYKEYSSIGVMFLFTEFFSFFPVKITIQMCYKLCAFGACDSKCPNNLYRVNSFWNKTWEQTVQSMIRLHQTDHRIHQIKVCTSCYSRTFLNIYCSNSALICIYTCTVFERNKDDWVILSQFN